MLATGGKQTGNQVEVHSFHAQEKHTVTIPQCCTAKYLHELLCKEIGLKPESAQLFGLFTGNLGTPSKPLLEDDAVPAQQPLCFQKWCFDMNVEAKALRHDDAAVHLLYNECQYYLRAGRIRPSPSQAQELEELSDPSFPTELQFLQCASAIDGYSEYAAHDCKILTAVQSNTYTFHHGEEVGCSVGWDALSVYSSKAKAVWPWNAVRRWKTTSPNVVRFEVCVPMLNAHIMCWLTLETSQAYFLEKCALKTCHIKAGVDPSGSRASEAKQSFGKRSNPSGGFLNFHFDVKQFTSIEKD